jgi:type III restriction enzyme
MGDNRDNNDSKRKLKLGRTWQDKACISTETDLYRYFTVFKNSEFGIDGAYILDVFQLNAGTVRERVYNGNINID